MVQISSVHTNHRMEKVSVVIPVYNQWHLVKQNIDALLKYDQNYIGEIVVVDDCSPEVNSYPFDRSIIKIIRNNSNAGYTATVNKGLKTAECELIVLLDSDAYPVKPFLQKLIKMYSCDEMIGCIGFGTVDRQGHDTGNCQYEPSVAGLILGQKLSSKLELNRFQRNKNILPYSCAVSFRKSCLAELNFFDEQVFKVLEADNDLSMRIHRSRWKLIFAKDVVICHEGGNSYKVNYKRVLLFHESRWKLLKKHGLIAFPIITKALIKARIRVELVVLKTLVFFKSCNAGYREKLQGRKILLKEINFYK